ncbi:MAG: hypothetical protein VX683_05200 [Cyanobacteriota bacterium]|nr:hypothetical protein [Cyanobacteriota bacterium]
MNATIVEEGKPLAPLHVEGQLAEVLPELLSVEGLALEGKVLQAFAVGNGANYSDTVHAMQWSSLSESQIALLGGPPLLGVASPSEAALVYEDALVASG